jgi:hypothetical protein
MHEPFIHKSIQVRRVSQTKFGVFAADSILRNTVIESCAIIPITRQITNAITRANRSVISDKLVQNPDGLIKERSLISSIKEMELEKRLDAGLLTQEDLKKILFDTGNVSNLLDVETNGVLLGFGSLYNVSNYPNVVIQYNTESKLYDVITVKDISAGVELTYLAK